MNKPPHHGYLSQYSQKPKPDYSHPDTARYLNAILVGLLDKTLSATTPEMDEKPWGFNGVLALTASEFTRFEECMTNPGEPTTASQEGAELLRTLYTT